jgi:hypothetical protein
LPDRYEVLLESRKIQDYLNTEVLHEILSNRHLWSADDEETRRDDSWFNDLRATDIWTASDVFDPQAIPEFARSWPHLDDGARKFFKLLFVNSKADYERSLILARLVEKLQEKLDAPESNSEDPI